jgi:CAAX prenyl protease-like protein
MMREYIIPFLAYILVLPFFTFILKSTQIAYAIHALTAVTLIIVFWKSYKLKFRFDFLAVATGFLIFLLWIALEGTYPLLFEIEYEPASAFFLIVKLIGFLIAAPLIEELFTRGFLIRFIVNADWKKVSPGTFTWTSFAITVLFFGLSHNRWLVGILAGVLLNMLLYYRKNIESCILAHVTANLLLALYILATGSWGMW